MKINGKQVEMNEESGNFACECGKKYSVKTSLNRHRKSCNAQNLMKQSESDNEQSIEDTISFSLYYNEEKD